MTVAEALVLSPAAEKLRAKFPPGLIAITRLPGLGPKRARLLHAELDALGANAADVLGDEGGRIERDQVATTR